MPNIKILSLSKNNLEGQIPSNIWKCTHLEHAYNFSGNIPRDIGRLSMLTKLYLGYNSGFQGGVPSEIGNLSRLEILNIDGASLTRDIPFSLSNMSSLTFLSLYDNSLTGSIPIFQNLQILYLNNNKLTGSLPSDLGNSLINLEKLLLRQNRLSGSIPSTIANASKLTILEMDDNSFSGSIPHFGNLKLLQSLLLSKNNLSGAEFATQELTFLSSLTNCLHLKYLAVNNNPLNGILPASVGNFSSSLEIFEASYCNIMGAIPSEIENMSSLLTLNLIKNQLSGLIPPTIGKMKQLQRLYLGGNQLVGSIPNQLCQMNHLGELDLSMNRLVGPIPKCLGGVKSLRDIDLGFNQLNSTVPPNFWTLTDLLTLSLSSNHLSGRLSSQLGNFKLLSSLDLSSNQFSGDIPTSIDGCQTLEFLDLSNNFLSGSILQSLVKVKGLKTLDLSYNNLSGSIPKSLEDLCCLENFNVSNNKLQGRIPDGGRFRNFSAPSFSDNLALCGPITFQVPACPENHHRSWSKKLVVSLVILAVIVAIALLAFIWMCKRKKVALSVDISPQITECRRISYIELEQGTSSFSETNLLGRGSFGSVFEGTLSDGLKVAVKVFNLELQGAPRSFDVETTILSTI
ncbi:LRR receptor-like serine/threonine-protein kinase FLS2 [Salvia hispanica]|uniref:LRR receptor-like serine/threonine-protein kinase FLS2 n=1 Tax=Salvia hispanica TaxID=49212 RepID=UPI0020097733|nr:LRR receptor-like serine/threonine-protein kinase FLS2 [Salvia hispanica]